MFMGNNYKLFIGFLLFALVGNVAYSTHLMGGDMTYKNIGNNRIEVKILVYRDCNGGQAQLDNQITYRIYNGTNVASNQKNGTSSYPSSSYTSRTVRLLTTKNVQPEIPGCNSPTGVCIQQGLYIDTFTLGTDTSGYHLVWFRNDRNYSAIDNLNGNIRNFPPPSCARNPFGNVWYSYVPPRTLQNSSPQFLTVPIPYICQNVLSNFNHNVYDPDGDSLVFSFATPYSPPPSCNAGVGGTPVPYPPGHPDFRSVVYGSGYSVTSPFGGSHVPIINGVTGEVSTRPPSAGNYVLAIAIKEYRVDPITKKVTYMGETRRDLQFVVGTCPSNTPPQVATDSNGYTRTVNPGDTVCLEISAADFDKDTLYFSATGPMMGTIPNFPGNVATFSPAKDYRRLDGKWCWVPTCENVTFSTPHNVTLTISDAGCNQVNKTYSIFVKPKPILKPPRISCVQRVDGSTVDLFFDTINQSDFLMYTIYRKKDNDTVWTLIDSIKSLTANKYRDTKAFSNETDRYHYYIKTMNTCRFEGAASEIVRTKLLTVSYVDENTTRLSWSKHKPKQDSKKFYYIQRYNKTTNIPVTIDSTKDSSFNIVACNLNESYRVIVFDSSTNCFSNSNKAVALNRDSTIPSDNGILRNLSIRNINSVEVTINSSSSADAFRYILYRSIDNINFSVVDTLNHIGNFKDTIFSNNANSAANSYYYKLKVADSCGNIGNFSSTYRTANLSGDSGQLRAILSWNNFMGYGVDSTEIEKYVNGNWISLAKLSYSDSSYIDSIGLLCRKPEYYRLKFTGTNYISYSDSVEVTPYDTVSPSEVNIIEASVNPNGTTVEIVFENVPDFDVNRYELYAVGGSTGSFTLNATKSANGLLTDTFRVTSFNLNLQQPRFYILAVDSCRNNKSNTYEIHQVGKLSGTAGNLVTELNWSTYVGFSTYNITIQRKLPSDTVFTNQTTVSSSTTSFTDTNVLCDLNYEYRLQFNDLGTDSGNSWVKTVTLKPFDTISPSKVNVIHASALDNSTAEVKFARVPENKVVTYELYQRTNTGVFSLVRSKPATSNATDTFLVSGLNHANNVYSYYVIAVDSCGGNKSKQFETHTTAPLSGTAGNLSANLSWSNYVGFSNFNITVQRKKANETTYTNLTTLNSTSTSYLDTNNMLCDIDYNYRLQFNDLNSDAGVSLSRLITVKPFDTISPSKVNVIHASALDNSTSEVKFARVPENKVVTYELYQRTNTGVFSLVRSKSATINATDTFMVSGLNHTNNVYSYYVIAVDSCGVNKSKQFETYTTAPLSGNAGNLSASLNWTNYVGFSNFNITVQRKKATETTYINLNTLSSTATSYVDTNNLLCDIDYNYRLQFNDLNSDAGVSLSRVITVKPFDTISPSRVNVIHASALDNSTTEVKFARVPENKVVTYELYQRTNIGVFSLVRSKPATSNATDTFMVSGLNHASNVYSYYVIAVDSCGGNKSKQFEMHTIANPTVVAGHLTTNLNWTNYVGFSNWNITIQRREKGQTTFTNVSTINSNLTSFTDNGLFCYVTYEYRLRMNDLNSDAGVSFTKIIEATPFDSVAPDAPIITNVTFTNGSQVRINFNPSISTDVDRHVLYEKVNNVWTVVDTIRSGNSYNHLNAKVTSEPICYRMVAIDSCSDNISLPSAEQCLMRVFAQKDSCKQYININWNGYAGISLNNYKVYRSSDSLTFSEIQTVNASTTTYQDANVIMGQRYWYYVAASLSNGQIARSYTVKDSSYKPSTPEIYFASKTITSPTNGRIVVKWRKQNNELFMGTYRLYHRTLGQTSFSLLANNININTDSFIHNTINTNNQNHQYVVLAVDNCGNIADSSSIHTTNDLTMTVGQLTHELFWTGYSGFSVDEYKIQQLIGSNWQTITNVSPNDRYYRRFPAACNSLITYRVVAVSDDGYEAYSDTASGQAIDSIKPDAPKLRNVSYVGNNVQVDFTGADSLDIFGYEVIRSFNGNTPTTVHFQPFTTPSANYTWVDNSVATPGVYCYTVTTFDSCLNFAGTDTFCLIYLIGQERNQANRIQATSFSGYTIANYTLEKTIGGVTTSQNFNLLSLQDTPLHCFVPVTYRVFANENGGNNRITYSNTITLTPFDTIIPNAPRIFRASINPDGSVTLTWDFVSSSDIKEYRIFREPNLGVPPTNLIATVGRTNTYTDNGVDATDINYSYYVQAVDSCDVTHISPLSNEFRTSSLKLSSGGCLPYVDLEWSEFKGFQVGLHRIYRKAESELNFSLIETLSGNDFTFKDTTTLRDVEYCYYIEAVGANPLNTVQNSEQCITPIIIPLTDPAPIKSASVLSTSATNGSVLITWNIGNIADTLLAGYNVYRTIDTNTTWDLVHTTSNINDTSYLDQGINTLTQRYFYRIQAFNICDVDDESNFIHRTMNLLANNRNLEVGLTWTAYEGLNINEYRIDRSENGSSISTKFVIGGSIKNFDDTTVRCDIVYTYRISGIGQQGEIVYSNEISVKDFDTIAPTIAKQNYVSIIGTATNGVIGQEWQPSVENNRAGYDLFVRANNGIFQRIGTYTKNNQNPADTILSNINTTNSPISTYIVSYDSCGNKSIPSDTHTTVFLTATAENAFNRVNWTPYIGFDVEEYVIERKQTFGNWVEMNRVSDSVFEYIDPNTKCFEWYHYRVRALSNGNVFFSYSNVDSAQAFELNAPENPIIKRVSVQKTGNNDGEVEFEWILSSSRDVIRNYIYRSEDGGNNFDSVGVVSRDANSFTDTAAPTGLRPLTYSIRTEDSCGNFSELLVDVHSTIYLKATGESEQTRLIWTAYKGFNVSKYLIFRDGVQIGEISGDSTLFIDSLVQCETDYEYRISALNFDETLFSFSNISIARPFDNTPPKPIYSISASVLEDGTGVELKWTRSNNRDIAGYRVYRMPGTKTEPVLIASINDPDELEFIDNTVDLTGDEDWCYRIEAVDNCENRSVPSNFSCLILLTAKAGYLENYLNWQPYQKWNNSTARYEIYKKNDDEPWVLIGNTPGSIRNYTDKNLKDDVGSFCYQVKAIESAGSFDGESRSYIRCVAQAPIVFIPNVFTPSTSLMLNDSFYPKGTFIKNYEMQIFNRWGQKIFETSNSEPWLGYVGNNKAPDGAYLYYITIEGHNSKRYYYKGSFMVLD